VAAGLQGGCHILRPLQWYASLHTAKGRDEAQAFLVEGARAISQIVKSAPGRIVEIVYAESMGKIDAPQCMSRIVSDQQYKRIGLSQHPAGPLAIIAIPQGIDSPFPPVAPGNRIVILEDIQDPGNIGALIRSAAALDFDGVLCSDKCADPFSPKATQASCGALVSLWLRRTRRFRESIAQLKESGFKIIAADMHGKPLCQENTAPEKLAIVLGNEGKGISVETVRLADEIVKIPINAARVESLNVAATGAIFMYMSRFFQGYSSPSIPL
jgi:TrmH family RNA methyltransferase